MSYSEPPNPDDDPQPAQQPPPGPGQPPQPSPWSPQPPQPYGGYHNEQPPGAWGTQPSNPLQQGYYPGYGVSYPRAGQATAALIISILGFLCCGASGLIGAIMGKVELNAIARGETDPSTKGTAMAAIILGLATAILFFAPVIVYMLLILVAGIGAAAP